MRFEKCLMTNDLNDYRKMEPNTVEIWSQTLPKDGAKQGESTRRKIFPLAKSRGNRKGHVVDRKIA